MSDKKGLLKVIDDQQQQLNRYRNKLRDVVAAYKSIVKEKDALEASLKVLNGDASTSDSCLPLKQDTDEAHSSCETKVSEIIEGGQEERSSEEEFRQLRDKVSTLTRALTTLTEERSRTEANHQADKKILRQEREEFEQALEKERTETIRVKLLLEEKTAELRNKLRVAQLDKDKENDHQVMMRELQTLIVMERSEKEKLKNQLEGLQNTMLSDRRNQKVAEECEAYRRQIDTLSEELNSVRTRLKAAEEQAIRPQPLLLELQREMADMKSLNTEAVLQERSRTNEAEERLQEIARASEERVAGLEAKLSELSETMGTYDRTRQQDQQAIKRLKERVMQLDIENNALVSAARHSDTNTVDNDDDLNLDVQGLLQRIIKLKGLLKVANLRSQNPVDLDDFLQREGLSMKADHGACTEELRTLKEEFEQYKCRAQQMLKSTRGGAKDLSNDPSSKDTETKLKGQICELRAKVQQLSRELDESRELGTRHMHRMQEELSSAKAKFAGELSKQESDFRAAVADLENQMHKQRQRTVTLLEEKDVEIGMLKMSSASKAALNDGHRSDANEGRGGHGGEEEASGVSDLLTSMGHKDDGHLLHYVQEIAKKDTEVSGLRKAKYQLESAMRELQAKMATDKERHCDQVDGMRHEIERLQRNRSRETGANLEYLKNVVLRFMLSSDSGSRQHMSNAIATMLEFSPAEVESVRRTHMGARWWPIQPTQTPTPTPTTTTTPPS